MAGTASPQKERNCSGVEAPRVPGAMPRRNEGHRGLRRCGAGIALGALSGDGKARLSPPTTTTTRMFISCCGLWGGGGVLLLVRS